VTYYVPMVIQPGESLLVKTPFTGEQTLVLPKEISGVLLAYKNREDAEKDFPGREILEFRSTK